MKATEKTRLVTDYLIKSIISDGKLFFKELRIGSGASRSVNRYVDIYTLETTPSKGHRAIAYEVKVSRADFMNDVNKPLKQRGARLFADNFYYVTPPGLLSVEEIPVWAGLIEVDLVEDESKYAYQRINIVIEAPILDKPRPTWSFLCSCIRNVTAGKSNYIDPVKIQKERDMENKIKSLEWQLNIGTKRK